MMATKYRLIYFNVTGLAEPIRYLFAYGKIPYEDVRLEYDDWLKFKPSTPFGQIPVLDIDGKLYNQSLAICRYFAKKLNLTGKTDWDAFQVDSIVDSINDFRLNYAAYFKLQTEEEKQLKLDEIKITHNPYYFNKFEEIVKKNKGYFVSSHLTWADIYFASLSDLWIKVAGVSILDDYPVIKDLKTKVDNQPNIKIYRDKRPETIF